MAVVLVYQIDWDEPSNISLRTFDDGICLDEQTGQKLRSQLRRKDEKIIWDCEYTNKYHMIVCEVIDNGI